MQLNPDVERLFHELADLPPEERVRKMVDQNVSADVRSHVEALLANDDVTENALDEVVRDAVSKALEYPPSETRCGPYRLLKLIGNGGMGSVYVAERADGEVRQKVAIKLLRFNIDTPDSRRLFQKERQIVADLSHPNIARLLDAGHADDGRPYFAMEYVEGVSIDEFCKELPLRRTLELFETLCRAVVYAHSMLVVHRDIKPGNVLVDSSGVPQLLDFGIAKLLDEIGDSTVTADRRLTPQFASPEQIQGLPVGAASDIFSLGALLYRLTTGQSPFRWEDYPTRFELENAIRNKNPVQPSQINRKVDKELQAIISKAMRKEPNERYASADAFREDVCAWLDHRPVRARQGGWWYIARRNLRRYWIPATAVAVTIAGLTAGLSVALHERDLARRRFADVHKFANDMLQVGTDIQGLPGSVPARERIVRTSLAYLEQLSKDAGSDLDLELDLGVAYRAVADLQGGVQTENLGRSGAALSNLAKSETFIRDVFKRRPDDPRVLRRLMLTLEAEYRLDEGLHRSHELRERAEELSVLAGKYERITPDTATKWVTLGEMYSSFAEGSEQIGDLSDSLRFANLAIESFKKLANNKNLWFSRGDLALARQSYANVLESKGDLNKALPMMRESLAILEQMTLSLKKEYGLILDIGAFHSDIGTLLAHKDELLGSGDHKEAVSELTKSLEYYRTDARLDPSEEEARVDMGETGTELGKTLQEADPKAALAVYDEAISALRAMPEQTSRRNFPLSIALSESVYPLSRLGRIAEAQKRLSEAKKLAASAETLEVNEGESLANPGEAISRAESVSLASSGQYADAIRTSLGWLQTIRPVQPPAERRLSDALIIADRYQELASVYRLARLPNDEQAALRKREELLSPWRRTLSASAP